MTIYLRSCLWNMTCYLRCSSKKAFTSCYACILPQISSSRLPVDEKLEVQGKCVACRLPVLNQKVHILMVLPCKHVYHSLCFSVTRQLRKKCRAQDCNMQIPSSALDCVGYPVGGGKLSYIFKLIKLCTNSNSTH